MNCAPLLWPLPPPHLQLFNSSAAGAAAASDSKESNVACGLFDHGLFIGLLHETEKWNLLLPAMNHMPFTQALVLVAHVYPAVVLFHDTKWYLTSVSWNIKVIACQRCCIKFTLPAFTFFTFSSPSDSWGFFRVNQIYILRSLGISGSPAQTKLPKAPLARGQKRPVWSNLYATSFHKW